MCTVVLRPTGPDGVLHVLALRDELVGRPFDDPGWWWPEHPGLVGGRDRTAGGTWCATDVASGTTALVLNRPDRPVAAAGAPSRGLLPLLAADHGPAWTDRLDVTGMASFTLVLAGPDVLRCWAFDGEALSEPPLAGGTVMVTSAGPVDGKSARHLARFRDPGPRDWRGLLDPPSEERDALVVRHRRDEVEFATVFGQLLEVAPGLLVAEQSRTPWVADSWSHREWTAHSRLTG